MIKNIAVIGVGGVGGYFGGKLCRVQESAGVQVSFLARGEHLRAIQSSGLLLNTESEGEYVCRPALATDNLRVLPSPDLCLLCVKEFDLAAILQRLKPMVRHETIILPLLNGMDVYARVRKVITTGVVLPACVYVGTHIERAGKVSQKGGACKILFGPDPLRQDFDPKEIMRLFRDAAIKCEWTSRVEEEVWTKFIFICGYGTVTAAYNKTVGEVFADDVLRGEVLEVMREAVAVASAAGVRLTEGIAEASLEKARNFPFETKTSFQRDFERLDRADERNLFAGALIERARELRVEVPKTQELFARLNERKPIVPMVSAAL